MSFYVLEEAEIDRILENLGYDPSEDLLRRNFDYYLQRTSHGSTLSRLVHAYLAFRIGETDLGWKYYLEALKSDYIDIQGGTTKEGIHAGVMAGTVLFVLRAFAGLSWDGSQLTLSPNFPENWRGIKFNLGFKDARYHFEISPEIVNAKAISQNKQTIIVNQAKVQLEPNTWIEIKI